jgi:hypothetical protein
MRIYPDLADEVTDSGLLQRYAAFPFSAESRTFLYALVIFFALVIERRMLSIPLLYWLLGAAVIGTGLHTWFRYDLHLALHSTARFSNVMMLAPVVSILFLNDRHLAWVFRIFMFVFLVAFASLLYQYGGGDMDTLVQGYVAIRADLIRHMTVVGEPNVGGMLAVIAFVIAMSIIRHTGWSVMLASLAIAFIFFSLSKAALLGLPVAMYALLLAIESPVRVKMLRKFAMALVLGSLLLVLIGADEYLLNSFRSIFGGIAREPSALEDLKNRMEIDRFSMFSGPPLQVLGQFLFGSSFGVAGSAAQEILGKDAGVVLPHNSYVELFMVGGATMLGLAIALVVRAFINLAAVAADPQSAIDRCALACLVLLSCWMLVYPVVYEPVLGTLLWTIVGYGNRVRYSEKSNPAVIKA